MEDALIEAHGLMSMALCDKATSEEPKKLFEGVICLMEAHASLGECKLLEDLFHVLPRQSQGDPELEEVLTQAASLLTNAYLDQGKTTKAIQAFKGAYPATVNLELRLKRVKTSLRVIEYLLVRKESREAAALLYDYAMESGGLSLGPLENLLRTENNGELFDEYFGYVHKAVSDIFLHLEKNLDFKEMERLYELLEDLGRHDLVLRLRVEKVIPLLNTALKLGRLSDAMRYHGVLTSLAHLDGAMELIPIATETLMEAYRETGDMEAVQRISLASL
jgi:tetratricopeptide (TPR) repeat protein